MLRSSATMFLVLNLAIVQVVESTDGIASSNEIKRTVDGAEIIQIESGTFFMGSNSNLLPAYEKPLLEVSVKAFTIDKYEISIEQYQKCVEKAKCTPINRSVSYPVTKDLPQTMITWHEAMAYCKWVGGSLPSEAQWEYAARGKHNTEYPWGTKLVDKKYGGIQVGHISYPEINKSPLPVNFHSVNLADSDQNRVKTQGQFGIYHLAGNVSEWTLDSTVMNNSSPSPRKLTKTQSNQRKLTDPMFAEGDGKIYKGADYKIIFPRLQRASFRRAASPEYFASNLGFRCVMNNP